MPYDFINTNPAIDQFNARVLAGDQARRQEQGDFYQRMGVEQALGRDRALRQAVTGYFGSPEGAPAIANFTAAPPAPPVQVPNPAAVTPVPSVVPADNPDYGGVPPRAAPAPNAVPATGTVPPTVVVPAPQPPVVTAPVVPQQRDRFAQMATTLAGTPGTGADAMHLVTTDVQSQRTAALERTKQQHEAVRLFIESSHKGDVASMRAINQTYGLGIPPEVLNNRQILAEIQIGLNTAKDAFGHTDPERSMAFLKGYLHAGGSQNPQGAIQAGIDEAQKTTPAFQAKHYITQPDGSVIALNVRGEGKDTGYKAHVPREGGGSAGGAGSGSKQQQYAEWRIKTLTDAGMPEAQAKQLVAGGAGTRPATPQQRLTMARNLMQVKPDGFTSLYKTLDEALKAVDAATGQQQPQGVQPQPVAAAPGAPKRMRFDASGNQIQ